MKNILLITASFLLVHLTYCQCDPISTFPWTESFENNGLEIPNCWDLGDPHESWFWQIEPTSAETPAHSGNYLACAAKYLYGDAAYRAWFITPVFDLSNVNNPVLSFWHKQFKDTWLFISYTDTDFPDYFGWKHLQVFTDSIILDWQQTTIALPNKSNHYQIAFRAYRKGGGTFAEVQLDDISIFDGLSVNSYHADAYSVAPNPVQDILTITRSNAEPVSVAIYNSMGALIHSFETSETDFQVNVSKYNAGIYFIHLSNNNRSTTKRFIKQ